MADRWHVNWLSEGVEQWNRRRKKVTFAPDLSGIRFFDLLPPDFRDAPKTSRFFERIDLSNANLAGADLSGLNFCNAAFSGANLTEADMSKSNFEKAKFTRANLAGANIARSLFSGAIFDNSIVTGVAFESAHISSALFIGSKLDTKQQNVAAIHSVRVFPIESPIGRNSLSVQILPKAAPSRTS